MDRLGYFVGNFPIKSWESKIGTFLKVDNSRTRPMPVPSGRSLVECSKASANGGDLPFYGSEPLVDCVDALVQVDRVAVGSR
jgi:hypothetical protein